MVRCHGGMRLCNDFGDRTAYSCAGILSGLSGANNMFTSRVCVARSGGHVSGLTCILLALVPALHREEGSMRVCER